MSANTKIEWADHTFNPWIGCTKVGPGCGSSCATCWTNEGNTMSQEINNELEFIRSILRGYKPSMARDDALYATARVKRLVGQDRAQRGEPVAWIWRFSDGELHETPFGTLVECERDAIGYAGSAIPLYTAPKPAQPERKPLTAQDLEALIEKWVGGVELSDSEYNSMVEFARTIEHLHGITEKK